VIINDKQEDKNLYERDDEKIKGVIRKKLKTEEK
jgi:hypothetical protein